MVGSGNKGTDSGHRLGEGSEEQVNLVGNAELFGSSGTGGTHGSETVGIVNQQAEAVFLLEGGNFVELAKVSGHAEHPFGDDEHPAVLLFGQLGGMVELLAEAVDIVVLENEAFTHVEAHPVEDAGVRFGIVNDHVVASAYGINDGNHPLVAVVEQEGIFLTHEIGQVPFQFFMFDGLSRHHAGTHRRSHAILGSRIGVGLPDLGMVGQSEVIVEAPNKHSLAPEIHVGTNFSLELRKRKIAVGHLHVAAKISEILLEFVKYVCHNKLFMIFKTCKCKLFCKDGGGLLKIDNEMLSENKLVFRALNISAKTISLRHVYENEKYRFCVPADVGFADVVQRLQQGAEEYRLRIQVQKGHRILRGRRICAVGYPLSGTH